MTITKTFKCDFCSKTFKRRSWFDRHLCAKKKRFLERHDIMTIKAHRLFNHWQRHSGLMRHGKEKSLEEFCLSPMFGIFKKLADFTVVQKLTAPMKYVEWLVEQGLTERDWLNPSNLDRFAEFTARTEDPETQALKTVEFIREWSVDHEIDQRQFFSSITPGQAMTMIRYNQISPWVIFGSNDVMDQLIKRFPDETLFRLDEHVNIGYWLDKIERDPEGVQKVCQILGTL